MNWLSFDHAATTPLAPEARAAMQPWLEAVGDNPASDHAAGRAARAAVEQARAEVAGLIGAEPESLIWTSGATESINLAIKGAVEFRSRGPVHLVTSRIEHRATLDTCRWLESRGHAVTWLSPDRAGRITVEQVLAALRPETVLVSLMWVNNEIGVVNPIEALAPLLRERGVLLHVDAAQAAAWLPVDVSSVPVDLLSLSAHKLYGPKGVGALYVCRRPRARLAPQLHGGGQEQGMRSGTLPTHQIVGFGMAATLARERRAVRVARVGGLRERLWAGLEARLGGLRRNSPPDGVPHILNLSVEGVDGESLRARLPDLLCSSGSACSAATREPSYVLRALGHPDALADASLRLSLGEASHEAGVDAAIERLVAAVTTLRAAGLEGRGEGMVPLGDEHNVFGYSAPIWSRFAAPRYAGRLSGGVSAVVGTPAGEARWGMDMKIDQGRVTTVGYGAFGCPVLVATAEWLAERWVGQALEALSVPSFAEACAALEIPNSKTHCVVMMEDMARALLQALDKEAQ